MTRIGVFPAEAFRTRPRLFEALEVAFPARFEERDPGAWRGLDAAILIGDRLGDPHASGLPCFVVRRDSPAAGSDGRIETIHFPAAAPIDTRLRGRSLGERLVGELEPSGQAGVALAECAGQVVWKMVEESPRLDFASVAPRELAPDQSLRDHLRPRRVLGLLPLIHFLRVVTGYDTWTRPPLRALFFFDDANLHWPSYGHLRYQSLADHARAHGYHVAVGLIPLDAWFTHPEAARLFHDRPELSIAVHGNDHSYREFGVALPREEAMRIFDQALARIGRLEQRYQFDISRVVIPPHGAAAEELLGPMVQAGFEALCRDGYWWHDWPDPYRSVAGWTPATASRPGLPIVTRQEFAKRSAHEEITLFAFLDQPIVLYGHHYDLADGYDVLLDYADLLGSFGEVSWGSLSSIVRSNVFARRDADGHLHLRSYSRRFDVEIPLDVDTLRVELDVGDEDAVLESAGVEHCLEATSGRALVSVPVTGGTTASFTVRPVARRGVVGAGRRSPPRAYLRRAATESRDRLYPVLRQAGLVDALRRLELAYDSKMARRLRKRGPTEAAPDYPDDDEAGAVSDRWPTS